MSVLTYPAESSQAPGLESEDTLHALVPCRPTSTQRSPSSSFLGKAWTWIKEAPSTLKKWAKSLKKETTALYYAYSDPRCPKLAKIVAIATVAYAVSPIDLIPDFIPVLGYVDDAILVPLGLLAAKKLIPQEVLEEARKKVQEGEKLPKSTAAAACIIGLWVGGAAYGLYKAAKWTGVIK